MDSCDVLIVGGGPAGSTLAGKLIACGLDVLVLDKSTFPRDKVCAGWITPATVDLLHLDRAEYMRGRVLQQISGFRTGMIGSEGLVTRYGRTISYGIRRSEFDHYLLERCGARLRLGEPLRSMEREGKSWIVNNDLKAPLVIGAGGHFCPVARSLTGGHEQRGPAVIAQEVEFEMDEQQQRECAVEAEIPELYFYDDLKGYAWCVRKGNFLNIGLGREDSHNVTGHVQSFVGRLKETGKVPENTPANFRGHAYRLYQGARPTLVHDGAMLIGDAAGLAYPKSGEGIRPAVESALAAAEVILSAHGDYERAGLLRYPFLLAARLGKGGGSSDIVPQAVKRFITRRLMESSWFSRHILLDRWFLNAHQPALH